MNYIYNSLIVMSKAVKELKYNKGLYCLSAPILENLDIFKFGISMTLEQRLYDYITYYGNKVYYKFTIEIVEDITYNKLYHIEQTVLKKTINYYSDDYPKETRSNECNILQYCKNELKNYNYVITENFIVKHVYNIINNIQCDKFEPRDYQLEILNNFKNNICNGIICLPTGGGKTISALLIIGYFMKIYPELSILWITKRIDILQSQFTETSCNIKRLRDNNYIPSTHHIYKRFNKKIKYDELQKPYFLIANSDKLLSKNCKLETFNIGLIIHDETHWAGAEDIYKFLKDAKTWKNLKSIIGLSATPIRPETCKIKRMLKIYGTPERKIHYVYLMTMLDAIKKNIVVPTEFYFIGVKVREKDDSEKQNYTIKDIENVDEILLKLDEIVGLSKTNKLIFWTKDIESCKIWKKTIDAHKYKLTNIKNYKTIISTSKDEHMSDFKKEPNYAILFAVGQATEGYDDEHVDITANLDPSKSSGVIIMIQKIGRGARKIEGKIKSIHIEMFIDNASNRLRQIAYQIVDYYMDLTKNNYSDIVLNETIKNIKVKLIEEGCDLIIDKDLKPIKVNIDVKLEKRDWEEFNRHIENRVRQNLYGKEMSYKDVREIVQPYKLNNEDEYRKKAEEDKTLPLYPKDMFNNCGWVNWFDFLGVEQKEYYNKEECIKRINELIIKYKKKINNRRFNISNVIEYLYKKDDKLPPPGLWRDLYNIPNINEIIKLQYEH